MVLGEVYMRVCTSSGTLVRCLLNMMMVSSNHTISLKIHVERRSLVTNTFAWPVGSHTNTSCLSNIAFMNKRSSSFRDICDICNFWRAYDTASEKQWTTTHNTCTTWHDNNSTIFTSPLHGKLPGYPIFWDFSFSEISRPSSKLELEHLGMRLCCTRQILIFCKRPINHIQIANEHYMVWEEWKGCTVAATFPVQLQWTW